MVDNTTLPGSGEVYASDDISSVKYQRCKLIKGADGVNDGDISDANPWPVIIQGGLVSTNNSTTSTLAGDAVFTGTGDDVTHYSSISVSWNSDVASADDGLLMQFSTDNSNWDRSIPVHSDSDTLQVNHGGVHRLSVIAQYFRVVYTNGVGAQSSFRLQTMYSSDNSLPLVSRIEQQLNVTSDCALTRSVTDFNLDLARVQITGQRTFFFFGFNSDVGTSYEDIHPNGGDINWPTSAATVAVSSSDAADTSAGLGVRSVEIHGLSSTGADQEEVIVMNGTTEVTSANSYMRINKMHNETVGTYGGSHQGDVTLRVSSGGAKTGDILSVMTGEEGAVDTSVQYGSGEAGNGYWSVPLGKVAYITGGSVRVDVASNKTVDIILYEREGILDTSAPMDPRRILWSALGIDQGIKITMNSYVKIKNLTDVFFRAKGSAASKVEVSLEFFLLDQNSAGA